MKVVIILLAVFSFVGCQQQGAIETAGPDQGTPNVTKVVAQSDSKEVSQSMTDHPEANAPSTEPVVIEEILDIKSLNARWKTLPVGSTFQVKGGVQDIDLNAFTWPAQDRVAHVELYNYQPAPLNAFPKFRFTDIEGVSELVAEQIVTIQGTVADGGIASDCSIVKLGDKPKRFDSVGPQYFPDVDLAVHKANFAELNNQPGVRTNRVDRVIISPEAVGDDGRLPMAVATMLNNCLARKIHLEASPTTELIAQIGQLPHLESLTFAISFSDDWDLSHVSLEPLVQLPRLRSLVFSKAHGLSVDHFEQIGRFTCLRELKIEPTFGDQLTIADEHVEHLGKLQGLRWLQLPKPTSTVQARISDDAVYELGRCVRLSTLIISSSIMAGRGLRGPSTSPNLYSMTIIQSPVETDGRDWHFNILSLRQIAFHQCDQLDADVADELLGWIFERFEFRQCSIDDGFLEKCTGEPDLRVFIIENCNITDAGVTACFSHSWPALEELNFGDHPEIGLASVEAIVAQKLPNLHTIDLSDTGCSNDAFLMLLTSSLPLTQVDFSGCNIDDDALESFCKSRDSERHTLKILNLARTQISDEGAKYLELVPSLERVILPKEVSRDVKDFLKVINPKLTLL